MVESSRLLPKRRGQLRKYFAVGGQPVYLGGLVNKHIRHCGFPQNSVCRLGITWAKKLNFYLMQR